MDLTKFVGITIGVFHVDNVSKNGNNQLRGAFEEKLGQKAQTKTIILFLYLKRSETLMTSQKISRDTQLESLKATTDFKKINFSSN